MHCGRLRKSWPRYLSLCPRDVWDRENFGVGVPIIPVLFSLNYSFPVFQKTLEEAGMGLISRICSKDAKTR